MASTTCNAMPVTIPKPPMPLAIDELDSCDSEPRTPAYTANRKSVHTTPTNSNQSSGNAGVPSSGSIDYNKFRTRMCHYHLIQKPCPFGERCAFAHGEEQINTPLPPAALERVMASHHRSTNGSTTGTGYCSQTRPLFHGSSNFLMGAPLPAPARPLPLFPAPMTRPPYSPTAGTVSVVTRLNQSANGSTSDAKLLATTVCSASVTRVSSMTGEEKPLSFTSAGESMMSSASCSSSALMPPPPAYECRVVSSDDFYAVGLPLSGRFRYDPYSPNGYCVIASA